MDCQKESKSGPYFITIYTWAQEWYCYLPSDFSPLLRPPKPDIRTISLTNLPQRRDTMMKDTKPWGKGYKYSHIKMHYEYYLL